MSQVMGRIATIILNWNGYKDTTECVESVLESEHLNSEIIIVDNGSSDGSAEILRQRFPQCKLIQTRENLGFAAGNNLGIRYALGNGFDYILLLNNDTVVEKDFLLPLITLIEQHPQTGVVQAKLLNYYQKEVIDSLGQEVLSSGGMRDKLENAIPVDNQPFEIFGACAAAALYKARLFVDAGLFDEAFFILFEDAELSWRIRLQGYKAFLVPDSIVYHKRGISGPNTTSKIRDYYLHRNNLFLITKYWPNNYFIKHLYFILFSLMRSSVDAFQKGEFQQFVLLLKRILKERALIQKNGRIKQVYHQWLV